MVLRPAIATIISAPLVEERTICKSPVNAKSGGSYNSRIVVVDPRGRQPIIQVELAQPSRKSDFEGSGSACDRGETRSFASSPKIFQIEIDHRNVHGTLARPETRLCRRSPVGHDVGQPAAGWLSCGR